MSEQGAHEHVLVCGAVVKCVSADAHVADDAADVTEEDSRGD